MKPEELSGSLIVVEGTDGSGRSTQISLLTEWLESEGFAVETMGLRRSFLVGEDIDALLAENSVTRMTLALMYGTDFFDQLERRILPALRSGLIVLADRYIFTLIARAAVRGISRDYLHGIYEIALRPDLTFWLNVRPEVAFDREFKKSQTISYWESGRDMSLIERSVPVVYPLPVDDQKGIRVSFEAARLHRIGRRGKRLRGEPGAPPAHRVAPRNPPDAIQALARLGSSLALNWPPRFNSQRSTLDRTPSDSLIARATSPQHIQILENERAAVRLGHNAFTRRMLDEETISRAARAFRHFRDRMDQHQVSAYRAVATSAAREVRNYRRLMERIQRKAGIELEVISSEEEARLVCAAVRWALGRPHPAAGDFRPGRRESGNQLFPARRSGAPRRASVGYHSPYGDLRNPGRDRRGQRQATAAPRGLPPGERHSFASESFACDWCCMRRKCGSIGAARPGAALLAKSPTINVRLLRDQTWRLLRLDVARTDASIPREKRPRGGDGHRGHHHHHGGEVAGAALDAGAGSGRARRICCSIWLPNSTPAALGSDEEKGRAAEAAGRRALVCAAAELQLGTRRTDREAVRFRFSTSCARYTRWGRNCG